MSATRVRKLFACALSAMLGLVLLGCEKPSPKSSIRVEFPSATATKTSDPSASSDGEWSTSVPASLAEIGCYAVFVGGPEPILQSSTCTNGDGLKFIRFGKRAGLFSAGSVADIEVPSGSARQIYILGFKLMAGTCERTLDNSTDLTFENYSAPYVIGGTVKDLAAGANEVTITLKEGFTSANKVEDCTFFEGVGPGTSPTPSPTPPPLQVSKIVAGANHACALSNYGALRCWGFGGQGNLGNASTANIGDAAGQMGTALPPIDLGTGRTALQVSAGSSYTCARLDNNQVKCWGWNNVGQLGYGDVANRGHSPATIGDNLPYVNIGTGRTALQIVTGSQHTCVLRDDGTVVCWGANSVMQLGRSGTTIGDGPSEMGDALIAVNFGGGSVVQLAAGLNHNCALMSDNTVKCWGGNTYGQLGVGNTTNTQNPALVSGITNASKVIVGAGHSCAVLTDSTLTCWGYNAFGQLGDGTLVDKLTPVPVSSITGVTEASGGTASTCALVSGAVYCWGKGMDGETGLNATTNALTPQPIPSLATGVTQLAGAAAGSPTAKLNCVIQSGQVKCWSLNTYGQLGQGHTTSIGGSANSMESLNFIDLGPQPPPPL